MMEIPPIDAVANYYMIFQTICPPFMIAGQILPFSCFLQRTELKQQQQQQQNTVAREPSEIFHQPSAYPHSLLPRTHTRARAHTHTHPHTTELKPKRLTRRDSNQIASQEIS